MMHLPVQAPSALEYFAALVADDASLPLLEAAITIAQDDHPALDPQAVLGDIDALAARLKQRLPNVNDYYDRRNSYLHEVLISRRGIPITLALLFCELAGQIGLTARGVSFPGHFLVKLRMPQGEVVIDPFDGHSLSREDLDERLAPFRKRQGLEGDFETPLGLFLQTAPARDVLARMLRNLKEIHRTTEDWPRLLAVQQRLVLLLPGSAEELRDRGLTWAELGRRGEAAADLEAYVAMAPGAGDAQALAERAQELRRSGSPRLH